MAKSRQLASRKVAVASAPTSAPSPNDAERSPNPSGPTWSVSAARSGTSTWKLKPTVETTVTTPRISRSCGSFHA